MVWNEQVKLVVVEDDTAQRKLIEVVLAAENFTIFGASDGAEGMELIRRELPSAVVADVMMPSLDGFEMCRRLRTDPLTSNIPIVFVSARAAIDDKLRAFDLGADDYLTKPYIPAELVSRVKAVMRRSRGAVSEGAAPEGSSGAGPDRELRVASLLSSSPGVLLAGRLSTASVIDVLQAISWGTISGRLNVSARGFGSIELRGGQLVHARVVTERGSIYGLKAWLRLASWTQGVFELRDVGDELPSPLERSINAPLQNLLLEAAYYRDELEKCLAVLKTTNMLLERRRLPSDGIEPLDLQVWSSAGETGIPLERLLDLFEPTDLELLQCVLRLLKQGALAAKALRRSA
jgi:CheY-like chemotaxis protein